MAASRSPARLCKMAVDLRGYLAQEIDPYDFSGEWILEKWNEAHPKLAVDPEGGEPPASKQFASWVKEKIVPDLHHHDPLSLPAYLHFDDVTLLPKGSWLIHFSDERFKRFDRGATLENLALSTWYKKKSMVSCAANRYPNTSLFEIVWGFAFDVDNRNASTGFAAKNYGRNVVIFQTDCAVEAWHSGDQQNQVIFPLCSEYHTHAGSYSGDWYFEGKNGEDLDFSSLSDAVEAAEKGLLA